MRKTIENVPVVSMSDVYRTRGGMKTLYRLLKEREKKINISHWRMPTWAEHCRFVRSRPYKGWFILSAAKKNFGAIYLSKQNEIGLFLFKKERKKGYGSVALGMLLKRFPHVKRLLANISPVNHDSIHFFEQKGFRHIQNTYELWRSV